MSFLIKGCELSALSGLNDIRISHGLIEEIHPNIIPSDKDILVYARGGLLIPGLHDHHIHLMSLAASFSSVHCGPACVQNREELTAILEAENKKDKAVWLRGIGYHNSVAGDIDRDWLDELIPDRPARIQHRGGRLWVLNSAGLDKLGLLKKTNENNLPSGLETDDLDRPTGRLYDNDRWLRNAINSTLPSLADTSYRLARCGITGVTDTSPNNSSKEWLHFKTQQELGHLRQNVRVMGGLELNIEPNTKKSAELTKYPQSNLLTIGEYKIHLLESELPDFDNLCNSMRRARSQKRSIAFHCVTHTELVFALASLEEVGIVQGDRIEHASITSPELLARIASAGLRVVTQPHFIAERGDQYKKDVEPDEQAFLYRLQSFLDAGIPLAAGSDAPFGSFDPWQSMRAATERKTHNGIILGEEEYLSPEQALALYTSDPSQPGVSQRTISPGKEASLCLLTKPWYKARKQLSRELVSHTWQSGNLTYSKH